MTLQIYNIKTPLSSILINIFIPKVKYIDLYRVDNLEPAEGTKEQRNRVFPPFLMFLMFPMFLLFPMFPMFLMFLLFLLLKPTENNY